MSSSDIVLLQLLPVDVLTLLMLQPGVLLARWLSSDPAPKYSLESASQDLLLYQPSLVRSQKHILRQRFAYRKLIGKQSLNQHLGGKLGWAEEKVKLWSSCNRAQWILKESSIAWMAFKVIQYWGKLLRPLYSHVNWSGMLSAPRGRHALELGRSLWPRALPEASQLKPSTANHQRLKVLQSWTSGSQRHLQQLCHPPLRSQGELFKRIV